MMVFVFVKDSHLSFVKTLTQSVSCSLQSSQFWSLLDTLGTPTEQGTKMVTVQPVEMTTNRPWLSQAEPRYACGNIP